MVKITERTEFPRLPVRTAGVLMILVLLAPLTLSAQIQTTPGKGIKSRPRLAYQPMSRPERWNWFVTSTIGPTTLATGAVSAGWGTWRNMPEEDGSNWTGFAKRYGMRLSGIATGNAIEAGLGMTTGEDPRYTPAAMGGPWSRVGHAATMTFMAQYRDGKLGPAYARYAGIAGNNFLSNAWRVRSESTVNNALLRTGLGFGARFAGNLFAEFRNGLHRTREVPR